MQKNILKTVACLVPLASMGVEAIAQPKAGLPNIIVIIADDLGYGDVSAYGAKAISTPGIDRLAEEGLRFTNGYSTSATSTPSRFALLTGEYPWRYGVHILPGDAPAIIRPEMETLPKLLQRAGYATGAVGKWHLGMGDGSVDWNRHISPGAKEAGFDYSFLMAATNDRVPTVYIRNGQVVGLDPADPIRVSYKQNFPGEPEARKNPEMLKVHPSDNQHSDAITNGVPRIGFMTGGKSALWVDEDMADVFLREAGGFVKEHKDKPFFLYYGLHQPHAPRIPHSRFAGKSPLGVRGDVILEADWCVAEFLKILDTEGIADNTIVIFTSDNGPVLSEGYIDQGRQLNGSHTPAGPWRGGKYSIYQGGTCVPFLVRWPQRITPGVSRAIVSQIDLYSSFAALVGSKERKPDSENVFKALIGESAQGREYVVVEAIGGKTALRDREWVYIPASKGKENIQLYHLKDDPGQNRNLVKKLPRKAEKMRHFLESMKAGNNNRN